MRLPIEKNESLGCFARKARERAQAMESKQRRSGRVTKAVPIVVVGSDSEELVFSEETKTVVLSGHGAAILSRYKMVAEQELILRVKSTDREAEVRVRRRDRSDGAYTYGVAFVNEALDFWGVEFPPARVWEERPLGEAKRSSGEGGSAGGNTGCRRKNERCGDAAGGESVDRRVRMRAKVNFIACVRTEKFGEDLVTCIDMSRGGVSFRSKNCYEKGQRVRIAVPFSPESPEAPAIFVPGRIAHAKSWREARCGCAG